VTDAPTLNERIHRAAGLWQDGPQEDEIGSYWPTVPDYEHDLNACMALIYERWPEAGVWLVKGAAVIEDLTARHAAVLAEKPTLAEALLAALEAEK